MFLPRKREELKLARPTFWIRKLYPEHCLWSCCIVIPEQDGMPCKEWVCDVCGRSLYCHVFNDSCQMQTPAVTAAFCPFHSVRNLKGSTLNTRTLFLGNASELEGKTIPTACRMWRLTLLTKEEMEVLWKRQLGFLSLFSHT